MMEPCHIDLSSFGIGELEEEGKKLLLKLDNDLQSLNEQHKTQKKHCDMLRKSITKYEKQLEDMNDDIHILEELKHKLINIPDNFNNDIGNFNELEALIRKKRENSFSLKASHKEFTDNFNRTRENLKSLEERLDQTKQGFKEKNEKLAIYDKWISVLVQRANALFAKITEMDDDLKTTIMGSTDVSDPAIMELKVVVDYKKFHIDRKISWYNDTVATLSNTRDRHEEVKESIESIKDEINNIEKEICDEINLLEKIEEEANSVHALFERTETQWNNYMEMQETYNRKEKLRTTEELLFNHWKEYCEIQQEENNARNNLFSESLDLSMLESNIALVAIKRDEIEAQIALRLSGFTE